MTTTTSNTNQDALIFAHVVSITFYLRNVDFDDGNFQIFRHGNRNAVGDYPNDPYNDEAKYWPEGYGQLTNVFRLNFTKTIAPNLCFRKAKDNSTSWDSTFVVVMDSSSVQNIRPKKCTCSQRTSIGR